MQENNDFVRDERLVRVDEFMLLYGPLSNPDVLIRMKEPIHVTVTAEMQDGTTAVLEHKLYRHGPQMVLEYTGIGRIERNEPKELKEPEYSPDSNMDAGGIPQTEDRVPEPIEEAELPSPDTPDLPAPVPEKEAVSAPKSMKKKKSSQ